MVIELGGGIFEGCSDQEGGALMSGTKGTDGFVQETPERALTIPYVRLQSHFLFQLLTTCNPPINKAGLCIHLKMMNHKLRDGQWLRQNLAKPKKANNKIT